MERAIFNYLIKYKLLNKWLIIYLDIMSSIRYRQADCFIWKNMDFCVWKKLLNYSLRLSNGQYREPSCEEEFRFKKTFKVNNWEFREINRIFKSLFTKSINFWIFQIELPNLSETNGLLGNPYLRYISYSSIKM